MSQANYIVICLFQSDKDEWLQIVATVSALIIVVCFAIGPGRLFKVIIGITYIFE